MAHTKGNIHTKEKKKGRRNYKYLPFLLFILLLSGCQGSVKEQEENHKMSYQQITAEEAKKIMDTEEGYLILDVRTTEEYDSGHIKNAVCLPNEEIVDKEPELLPDKEQKILVYCRSGNRSKQAAEKLAAMGYENVIEFGGIMDWPYEVEE